MFANNVTSYFRDHTIIVDVVFDCYRGLFNHFIQGNRVEINKTEEEGNSQGLQLTKRPSSIGVGKFVALYENKADLTSPCPRSS